MKYYAVTEDPNELFHYGVKGMKWGQHIFGDKPKSPGYKRALGKLRASAKSAKSAIQKSATQHSINKQNRQMDRYNKAVQKAQRNNELVNNLYNLDRVRVNERGLDRDYWGAAKVARIQNRQQQKIDRINNKRMIKEAKARVKYNRNETKMDKYMQQAREGKLKYGQLSDDQVQRLTNRLNMERNARQLGSAEKTWRQQKKEAFRQGKLQGITKGTAAAMEEVARAGTIYGIQNLMNRKKRNALAKQQGKEQRIKNREQNKKSRSEIRQDLKTEAYEAEIRSGKDWSERHSMVPMTAGKASKILKNLESEKHEQQRIQNVQDKLANERDEKWANYLNEKGLTEKEALKLYGGRLNNSDKKAEIIRNEEGYKKAIEEAAQRETFKKVQQEMQRRFDNDAIEARNAKREEQFISALKEYKENVEYNKAEEAKYKEKLNEYNQKMDTYREDIRMWNNNPTYRANHDKPIEPAEPSKPKLRDVSKKPKREDYGFETINEKSNIVPTSYEQFKRYREMGVNMGSMFSNGGGGGNNSNKNKNKNKKG